VGNHISAVAVNLKQEKTMFFYSVYFLSDGVEICYKSLVVSITKEN